MHACTSSHTHSDERNVTARDRSEEGRREIERKREIFNSVMLENLRL